MESLVRELIRRRSEHCFPLGVRSAARTLAESILAVLFPHFSETLRCDEDEVTAEVTSIQAQLTGLMSGLGELYPIPDADHSLKFVNTLPQLYTALMLDAK